MVFSFCCLTRTSGSSSGCGYARLTISLTQISDRSLCYPQGLSNDLLFAAHTPHGKNLSINSFITMTDHDVKKVARTFHQILPAHPSTTRDINSSTPLFIEPQISRYTDLGCFIDHPLTQNNTTC